MQFKSILPIAACVCVVNTAYAQNDSLYTHHISKAEEGYNNKNYKLSAEQYSLAFTALGNKGYPNDRYNAACSWALAGNPDSAFHNLLIIAEKTGYSNYTHLVNDTDLEAIRKDARWAKVTSLVSANKEKKEANLDKPLVRILDSVLSTDQGLRMKIEGTEKKYGRDSKEMKDLWKQIQYHDSVNTITVTDILDKRGWLGPEVIGAEGNSALFLVIQHAEPDVQQKYLPMMREAVKNGKAQASSLALLEDRVALGTGGKQIYGSQVMTGKDGSYYVMDLQDPENVDKRRAEVGLGPLNEYTMHWNFKWDVAIYKKQEAERAKAKNK